MIRRRTALVAVSLALACLAPCARACDVVGTVLSLQGSVTLRQNEGETPEPARLAEPLCDGATIEAGDNSRALLALVDQSKYRLDQNTALHLSHIRADQPSLARLLRGAAYFFSRQPRVLRIDTPYVNAAIEGTEFLLVVGEERTDLQVFEGTVAFANDRGRLVVGAGEAAAARSGEAPRTELVARPRDRVQWTIYYPYVLLALADPSGRAAGELPPPLREPVALAAQDRTTEAFAGFDGVPETERSADWHLYRAGALLSVGQAGDARREIDAALGLDPRLAAAWSLRAVIALANDDTSAAAADAEHARSLDPESVPALLALSYVAQARFRLRDAHRAAAAAIAAEPENALAWTRMAEIRLMLGERLKAVDAARRAGARAPDLARTQTVMGFAALSAIDIENAVRAFDSAIAIDPADPLPRFGRGLAEIRAGRLREGRLEIEAAVALDPADSMLRSYLGNAYFEEKKEGLAGEQFAIARALDPNDPTPWFYDAIRKRSENRPVEALRDLQSSMALNDGRAVYRSRALLDADQAARGASLARIYDDLGFSQLGVEAATRSLALDPTNAAAHRFLADTYVSQPGREVARVSELLQAQLLQDPNIDPIQPSLAQAGLGVDTRGGPAQPGFNEYSPLFQRNQAQMVASTEVGNQYTFGEETVLSGLYNQYSLSAGQYYYETDGYRKNFDLGHEIYNLYAQTAVTPELNVQGEFTRRVSEEGNRSLTFQDDYPLPDRRKVDQDVTRLGLRWTPSPGSTVLLSLSSSDFDERRPPVPGKVEQDGSQIEGQYIWREEAFNVVTGAGAYHVDQSGQAELPFGSISLDNNERRANGYVYVNWSFPAALQCTAGLSYDDYDENKYKAENKQKLIEGKLGFRWFLTQDVALRAALFQVSKPALVASRTIEPTQVAGFDQFRDDPNSTRSTNWGVGMDARLSPDLSAGVEFVRRDLDAPYDDATSGTIRWSDVREDKGVFYVYWAPFDQWAFTGALQLDRYNADQGAASDLPSQVQTVSIPLGVRWFGPDGLFAGLGGTWVWQDVNRPEANDLYSEGSGGFFVLDATVGYRLPRRLGIVSLQAQNLLDRGFRYQDDRYRTFEQQSSVSPFLPTRTILGRVTLNF